MPPRKKLPTASTSALPAPEPSHPSARLIPAAVASSTRLHPPAYHSFIRSPHFPTPDGDAPAGGKKRKAGAGTGLVPPGPGAVEVGVLHGKLLGWFDGVSEQRGMPWRKDVDVKALVGKERTQRGYEVSRAGRTRLIATKARPGPARGVDLVSGCGAATRTRVDLDVA